MRHRSTIAALLALAGVSSPIAAQSAQRWSLQGSGLFVGVFGDAYEGLKSGAGGELQVRVTPSLWSYGAGAQYSSHGLEGQSDYNVTLTGVFFEPRRVLDIGSAKVAPYLSARLAYLQLSADVDPDANSERIGREEVTLTVARRASGELTSSGFQGNLGGGVLIKMSPRVNLDLGATIGVIRFGEVEYKVDGRLVGSSGSSSGTGQNLVVRAGLAVGLGGRAKK